MTTNPNNELPLDQENDRPVCSPNDQLLPVPIISEVLEITESFDDDLLCEKKENIHRVAIQEEVIQIFKDESILNCYLHITVIHTSGLVKKRREKARGFY